MPKPLDLSPPAPRHRDAEAQRSQARDARAPRTAGDASADASSRSQQGREGACYLHLAFHSFHNRVAWSGDLLARQAINDASLRASIVLAVTIAVSSSLMASWTFTNIVDLDSRGDRHGLMG